MSDLGLRDVMKLLGLQTIPGKSWQAERLRKWIERLVESRGEAYVLENRRDLLKQWEEFSKAKFTTCV